MAGFGGFLQRLCGIPQAAFGAKVCSSYLDFSRVITAVKNSSTMAKTAAGVAFATTAIAITFYYRRRSQREQE